MKHAITGVAIGMLVLGAGACASAKDLEARAKVPQAEARRIALAKVPDGLVQKHELEEERGKLIWSFDISRPGVSDITEVQVDARTGEIVSIESETLAQQAEEAERD